MGARYTLLALSCVLHSAASADVYTKYTVKSFRSAPELKRSFDPNNKHLLGAALYFVSNEARAKNGKKVLPYNQLLQKTAQLQADHIAKGGATSHINSRNPKYRTVEDRAKASGIFSPWVSENVASAMPSKKFRSYLDIADQFVWEQWRNSPGHWKNLLAHHSSLGCAIGHSSARGYAKYGAVQVMGRGPVRKKKDFPVGLREAFQYADTVSLKEWKGHPDFQATFSRALYRPNRLEAAIFFAANELRQDNGKAPWVWNQRLHKLAKEVAKREKSGERDHRFHKRLQEHDLKSMGVKKFSGKKRFKGEMSYIELAKQYVDVFRSPILSSKRKHAAFALKVTPRGLFVSNAVLIEGNVSTTTTEKKKK